MTSKRITNTTNTRNIGIILCCIIVLIISGCNTKTSFNFGQKEGINATGLYLDYVQKSIDTKEYKTVYSFDMTNIGLFGSSTSDIKIGIFKKYNNTKTVAELSVYGSQESVQSFVVGNSTIVCTDGMYSYSTFGGDDNNTMKCEVSNHDTEEFNQLFNFLNINETKAMLNSNSNNIEFLGTKKILDRNCDLFKITLKNFSAIPMFQEQTASSLWGMPTKYKNSKFSMFVCLDTKTGVLLEENLSKQTYSELLDRNETKSIFSYKLLSFSDKVNDKVFEIPSTFNLLKTVMTKTGNISIAIFPFKDIQSDIKVQIFDNGFTFYDNKAQNETATPILEYNVDAQQLNRGKVKLLYLSVDDLEKLNTLIQGYSGKIKICIGDDCKSERFEIDKMAYDCLVNSNNKNICNEKDSCMFKDSICQELHCYNIQDKDLCSQKKCFWNQYGLKGSGYCSDFHCYNVKNMSSCQNHEECSWIKESQTCKDFSCYILEDKDSCESTTRDNCKWLASDNPDSSYCTNDYGYDREYPELTKSQDDIIGS